MKIAALSSGKNTPSTRFRIRQHINPLADNGIIVNEYYPVLDKNAGVPSKLTDHSPQIIHNTLEHTWRGMKLAARLPGLIGSWTHDITWLGRELLPGYFTFEHLLSHPLAFDVDDAIWHAKPYGLETVKKIARHSDIILAGNNFLADWFSQYSKNVSVVPTAVDTNRYCPCNNKDFINQERFIIGWTGISGNFPYLYNIEKGLYNFLKNYNAELLIVANAPPQFKLLKPEMVRFVQWSPQIEAQIIQEMHVGLMPLPDSEWSKGKCSLKMLTYMACGIPVVVSPVGMNKEVLALDDVGLSAQSGMEYYAALELLFNNRQLCQHYGKNARQVTETNYSRTVISNLLAESFGELHQNQNKIKS